MRHFASLTAGLAMVSMVSLAATSTGRIPTSSKATFDAGGDVLLPQDYRRWQHVGTRIKPDGRSVLDEAPITTPQVMDAYVEPAAFEQFMRNGVWPDGTQIIKEISQIRSGAGCDRLTFVCSTEFGTGIFEASYLGMGMMVKDSKRFANEPGNWGYYSFMLDGSGYQRAASIRPREQCAACHMNLAARTDYVFSHSHIGLVSAATP
jgi:hypothetical protein